MRHLNFEGHCPNECRRKCDEFRSLYIVHVCRPTLSCLQGHALHSVTAVFLEKRRCFLFSMPSRLKAIWLIMLFIFIACKKRCWGQGWHMVPRSLLPQQRSSLISDGYWQRTRLLHQIPSATVATVSPAARRSDWKWPTKVLASCWFLSEISSQQRILIILFACTHVCEDDAFPLYFL